MGNERKISWYDQIKEVERELREQLEGEEKHILSISLSDYAASRGRNPKDYELQGLFESDEGWSYNMARDKALIKLKQKRIETSCEVVVDIRFDSHDKKSIIGKPCVSMGVTGTGLRLKNG